MGKKGKKTAAGKPKKLTPKDIGKRLDALAKKLEEELKGADLFAPLPPLEDCAICLVPLSRLPEKSNYKPCCGKRICLGCMGEIKVREKEVHNTCPFCRKPAPANAPELLHWIEARASKGDSHALNFLGTSFYLGDVLMPKDDLKALDCYIRAVKLGNADACSVIASASEEGRGVSVDKKRAALFERVGALRGSIMARHDVGCTEYNGGNHEVGIRHWKIAAEAGMQLSLTNLRKIYNADGKKPGKEFISKDELDKIYRAGHEAQEEVKSEEREKHFEGEDELKC